MTAVLVTNLSRDLPLLLLSAKQVPCMPCTHLEVACPPMRKKGALKIPLVSDSVSVFSLDENDFNIYFLKKVGQSQDMC